MSSSPCQDIHKEQSLLEQPPSEFPVLQTLVGLKQPYDLLWSTALSFYQQAEVWMNSGSLHTARFVCALLLLVGFRYRFNVVSVLLLVAVS